MQTHTEEEEELRGFRELHQAEREQLQEVIATLKNDIETIKRQKRRIEEERDTFIEMREKAKAKKRKLKEVLNSDKLVRIRALEEAKREVQERLKKKETELYKYKFKIKDL